VTELKAVSQDRRLTKKATCHTFRRSIAKHLLEDGHDIRTVQELLGHREVSTMMTYTQVLNRGPAAVRSRRTGCSSDDRPVLHGSATQDRKGAAAADITVAPCDFRGQIWRIRFRKRWRYTAPAAAFTVLRSSG